MEHHRDITKNWMSFQNVLKDKTKTYQGGCQETFGNIKGAAGIYDKYRLLSACDNNELKTISFLMKEESRFFVNYFFAL